MCSCLYFYFFFFFFQAEDGIRDKLVTGVQTCALPIFTFWVGGFDVLYACQDYAFDEQAGLHSIPRHCGIAQSLWIARILHLLMLARSEERRVGKEGRAGR